MRFTKMHGVGNDFIILDPEEVAGRDLPGLARKACDRHFGVGADGILIPASSEVADLRMVYLNSDGSPSEMCGNGLRCLVHYAKDRGMVKGDAMTVATGAGETLASGSGSCAAAVAAVRRGLVGSPVRVVLDGGVVEVEWEGESVYMMGPAEYVCEGQLL